MTPSPKPLLFIAALAALPAACASAGACRDGARAVLVKGRTTMTAPGARALTVGPAVVHAEAAESGATLFYARAETGLDKDCGRMAGGRFPLAAGRSVTLEIGEDEVACLLAHTSREIRVQWHAHGRGGGNVAASLAMAPSEDPPNLHPASAAEAR
jgi:hypothetical protein